MMGSEIPATEILLAILGTMLWWQIQRQVGRIDRLEVANSDLRERLALHHYNKTEVQDAVRVIVGPMQKQLDNIEQFIRTRGEKP